MMKSPLFSHSTHSFLFSRSFRSFSTAFHVRESPLTEALDYFSASGLVLFNLYCILIRLIDDVIRSNSSRDGGAGGRGNGCSNGNSSKSNGNAVRVVKSSQPSLLPASVALPEPVTASRTSSKARLLSSWFLPSSNFRNKSFLYMAIGLAFAAFYWRHVSNMMFYFDYGYNMRVNIAMGTHTLTPALHAHESCRLQQQQSDLLQVTERVRGESRAAGEVAPEYTDDS